MFAYVVGVPTGYTSSRPARERRLVAGLAFGFVRWTETPTLAEQAYTS
jgi:hypothetical protein